MLYYYGYFTTVKLKVHDFLTRITTTHLEFGDGSKS